MGQPAIPISHEGAKKIQKMDEDLVKDVMSSCRVGSLSHRILSLIAYKSYQQGVQELQDYINMRSKEYSAFYLASHRYFLRIQSISMAVEKQRSAPNLENYPEAKKHEVYDLLKEYFKELRNQIKGVENAEYALRVEDVRSTVWVVRAMAFSVIGIFVLGFCLDLFTGSYSTIYYVVKGYYLTVCDWVVNLF